jgi:outer membrane receptor for ferric coprogen and ferric-rhodotorulic acid
VQGPFELFERRHEAVFGFNWSDFKNFHEPQQGAGIEGRYVNIYDWNNETAGPAITGTKLMTMTAGKNRAVRMVQCVSSRATI